MKTKVPMAAIAAVTISIMVGGCGSAQEEQDRGFHTSGSREADQRAEQRIAREQQIRGESNGQAGDTEQPLYERLGGEAGIRAITDDFVDRALKDPRVNWHREGVRSGGLLGLGDQSEEWEADARDYRLLKQRIAQFLALATGGPVQYSGTELRQAHRGMKITNAEFDAAIGDLKVSLDVLGIPTQEQKELLAIVESTRPQIVEVRR